MADNPCKTCTKVENPKECANKYCKEWKLWFLNRWGDIYNFSRAYQKITGQKFGGKDNGKQSN